MSSLGVISILSNEEHYVEEWLTFLRLVGVSYFFLAVRDCTDTTIEKIKKLPFRSQIFLQSFNGVDKDKEWTSLRPLFESYCDGIDCKWWAHVPPNELLFRLSKNPICEFFDTSEDVGAYAFKTYTLGPTDQVIKPKALFTDAFITGLPPTSAMYERVVVRRDTLLNWTDKQQPALKQGYRVQELNGNEYRWNVYLTRSLEDLVEKAEQGEQDDIKTVKQFDTLPLNYLNNAARVYSSDLRRIFNRPVFDATPDNTVFLSFASYENPDNITRSFRRTAKKFGYDIHWLTYGEQFDDFITSKTLKLLSYLTVIQNQKKYAFCFDSRDVVFVGHVKQMLDIFNVTYSGGVLFNSDIPGTSWPLNSPQMRWNLQAAGGAANAGVFGGRITDIIFVWMQLLKLREMLLLEQYDFDRSLRYLSIDKEFYRHLSNDRFSLLNDDQFFVQLGQVSGEYDVKMDTYKQLFAVFNKEFPSLTHRKDAPYQNQESIGSALILHSPWLSKDQKTWDAWVRDEILTL